MLHFPLAAEADKTVTIMDKMPMRTNLTMKRRPIADGVPSPEAHARGTDAAALVFARVPSPRGSGEPERRADAGTSAGHCDDGTTACRAAPRRRDANAHYQRAVGGAVLACAVRRARWCSRSRRST